MIFSFFLFYDDPTHIDLVAYIHPDFQTDTIIKVVNDLDLGKINRDKARLL